MSDVEIRDSGNGGNRLDVVIVEAVAGVHQQFEFQPLQYRLLDAHQLLPLGLVGCGIRIPARVNFYRRCAGFGRRLDLIRVGIDEQGYPHAGIRQPDTAGGDFFKSADHVQTAFGGQLLTPLGNQAAVLRAQAAGKRHDIVRHRHFEIHAGLKKMAQHLDIPILDMPAIFTQMQRDGIGTGLLGLPGRLDGIGIARATRLAQGGHVVDINTQLYQCPSPQ